MGEKNSKYIYVLFIKAHTLLGKCARVLTDCDYSHVAISLSPKCDELNTFARRRLFTPFDAGFVKESRESVAYGEHEYFCAKVYRVPVSFENYKKIKNYIIERELDMDYILNIYSMVLVNTPALSKSHFDGIKIRKALDQMQFVAEALNLSGTVKLSKSAKDYNVRELDELLESFAIPYKKGKIYRREKNEDYTRMPGVIETVGECINLNYRLISRLTE